MARTLGYAWRLIHLSVDDESTALALPRPVLPGLPDLRGPAWLRDLPAVEDGPGAVSAVHLPAPGLCRARPAVPDRCAARALQPPGTRDLWRAGVHCRRSGGRHRRAPRLRADAAPGNGFHLWPAAGVPERDHGAAGSIPHGTDRYRQLRQHRLDLPGPDHADVVGRVVRAAGVVGARGVAGQGRRYLRSPAAGSGKHLGAVPTAGRRRRHRHRRAAGSCDPVR